MDSANDNSTGVKPYCRMDECPNCGALRPDIRDLENMGWRHCDNCGQRWGRDGANSWKWIRGNSPRFSKAPAPLPEPAKPLLKRKMARLAEIRIDGMTMWVEYNPVKADLAHHIAEGIEIETVCAGGEEISDFIEINCPDVWDKMRAAILAKISE